MQGVFISVNSFAGLKIYVMTQQSIKFFNKVKLFLWNCWEKLPTQRLQNRSSTGFFTGDHIKQYHLHGPKNNKFSAI